MNCYYTHAIDNTKTVFGKLGVKEELLWNGSDVEILEPASLRKEMAEMVERMWNKYKNDKK